MFTVLGILHSRRVKQAGHLIDVLHPLALRLDRGIDRPGMVGGGGGRRFCLGDLVRIFRPEFFQSHRVTSCVGAGRCRRGCMCLDRSGRPGRNRRNVVRHGHAGSQVHRAAVHQQAPPVGAGRDVQRFCVLDHLIRKALLDRLAACHVGGIGHHVDQHGFGQAGLAVVNFCLHLVPGVVFACQFPQLVGIVAAPQRGPALVDHYETGRVDPHRIAGAHDKRPSAHGHAVHHAGQLHAVPCQLTQAVVDGV